MYKAGVMGCGQIGVEFPDNHAKAYIDCPDTELVWLNDESYDKWYTAQEKYPTDGRVQDCEIISICTPPEWHLQCLMEMITCAPKLKAIYCEKPIADTLERADKMIELCHEHNIILQVNHQRRFGRPTMYFNRGVLNNGTHAFDMLRMLFGKEVIHHDRTYCFRNMETWKVTEVDVIETPYSEKTDFRFEIVGGTILKGVEHLVDCIKNGHESISSGEEAREDLRLCLTLL